MLTSMWNQKPTHQANKKNDRSCPQEMNFNIIVDRFFLELILHFQNSPKPRANTDNMTFCQLDLPFVSNVLNCVPPQNL